MSTPGPKDWTTDLLIGGFGLFVGGGLLLMSVLANA